jgi:hypothetical protein
VSGGFHDIRKAVPGEPAPGLAAGGTPVDGSLAESQGAESADRCFGRQWSGPVDHRGLGDIDGYFMNGHGLSPPWVSRVRSSTLTFDAEGKPLTTDDQANGAGGVVTHGYDSLGRKRPGGRMRCADEHQRTLPHGGMCEGGLRRRLLGRDRRFRLPGDGAGWLASASLTPRTSVR